MNSNEELKSIISNTNVTNEQLKELEEYLSRENISKYMNYTHIPVGIREFVESEHYLDAKNVLYPIVLDELVEMNSGRYYEAVLTGAIGAAKTTLALYSTAYTVYLLSCMRTPQKDFGLDPSSEIYIIFQAINVKVAKAISYDRFKAMIDRAPYFQKYFPFNKRIESELHFPNRIIVRPVAGNETAAIGGNVIAGVIDELNFMQRVKSSKQSIDGGQYDQAIALYNSISKRRKSRFLEGGAEVGLLCLVSSKRYPGQFTDVKIEQSKKEFEETGIQTLFVYDKRTWDITPEKFTSGYFKLYPGSQTKAPKILETDEEIEQYEESELVDIPNEFIFDFKKDPYNSLRDIAGISTIATHPYIHSLEAIDDLFINRESILSEISTDFSQPIKAIPGRIINNNKKRWAHIDLSLTGDSASLVIGHVDKFAESKIGVNKHEILPFIYIDVSLQICAPLGGEINFEKIRSVIYTLNSLGLNIQWISFDGFQSRDGAQILTSKGYTVGYKSMDKDNTAYDTLKNAIISRRLNCHTHPVLHTELVGLEKTEKGKVDHLSNNSKDIADSLAGVVFGLTNRRELWIEAGITPRLLPQIQEDIKLIGRT